MDVNAIIGVIMPHVAKMFEAMLEGEPENELNKVFDPFFTTKGVQATGLGMSVSYGIISRHHGSIQASSKLGEGAQFTIRLPLQPAPDAAGEEDES